MFGLGLATPEVLLTKVYECDAILAQAFVDLENPHPPAHIRVRVREVHDIELSGTLRRVRDSRRF